MRTSEAMAGRESIVLKHFGLPPVTGNKHIDCIICGAKKKFRLNHHNGIVKYICVCGSGSVMDLILETTCMQFADAARKVDEIIGRTFNREQVAQQKPDITEQVIKRFQGISPVHKTPGETYLNSRGIYKVPTRAVKYSPEEYDREYDRCFGALYSIATDDQGSPCYVHKTYLEGSEKAYVEKAKKMRKIKEPVGSVAVRMFDPGTALGIAEGIETALSGAQIHKLPVWAALNTSFLKRFRAPIGVEHLIIFADSDESLAGHSAAFQCAHLNLMANNDVKRVTIRWPDQGDFNDVLTDGRNVFEWAGYRR